MKTDPRRVCYPLLMRHAILLIFLLLLMPVSALALGVEVEVDGYKSGSDPSYGPANLMDGDEATVWAGSSETGSGEWIELHFAEPVQVERLGIFNGHQGGRYSDFRRVRSGRVVYPDGKGFRFWLRDEQGEQFVYCLGTPVKSLRIEIDSVTPASREPFRGEVALSGITLYLSSESRAAGEVNDVIALNRVREQLSDDPERAVSEDIARLLRMFYVLQTTLSDDYPELFAEDVRDQNDFQFEVFKEMQRQRGTYGLLREARVNASGLGFEKVEEAGAFMRVRAFGTYRVWAGKLDRTLEEDSFFVLTKENGEWKILELEEE